MILNNVDSRLYENFNYRKKDKICPPDTNDSSLLVPIALLLPVLHSLAQQRAATIFINIYFKPILGVFVKSLLGPALPIKF